jgi:hypothetical protein
MSEWVKARGEAGKEFREMEKAISGYSYKDPEHAEKTDRRFRELIALNVRNSRDFLFPMIEAAYLQKDFDNAGALDDVMQWLDVFLLELGLKMEWNENANCKGFVSLIKSDVTMLRNSKMLAEIIEQMQKDVLHGKGGSVVRKCAQRRKYISDLLLVFKKRRHSLGG